MTTESGSDVTCQVQTCTGLKACGIKTHLIEEFNVGIDDLDSACV